MTPEAFRSHIRTHNAVQVFVGLLSLAGAPLLWWFSFWVIRIMFWLATSWFLGEKTAQVTFWIAVVGVVILAVEGLRQGWEMFTLEDVAARPRIPLLMPIGAKYAGDLQGWSYLLTQMLFVAPRVTLAGLQALRDLLRPGRFTIELAVQIHNDLAARRAWVGLEEYPGGVAAAGLLKRLGLIWLEEDEQSGAVRLRIPPGEAPAE